MGKGGFCTKNANFFAFLKKNFGGIWGNSVRAMPAHWNREIPAFAGMGRGGEWGKGEWEVLFWGVFLFGVFLGCFFLGGVGEVRMRVRGQKLNNSPFPRKREWGKGREWEVC